MRRCVVQCNVFREGSGCIFDALVDDGIEAALKNLSDHFALETHRNQMIAVDSKISDGEASVLGDDLANKGFCALKLFITTEAGGMLSGGIGTMDFNEL